MAKNDWDLDDLLEFHFDREVPETKKIDNIDEDRKLYEELRRKSKGSNAPAFDVSEPLGNHKWIDEEDELFAQYDKEHAFSRKSANAPVVETDEHTHQNIKEIEAIKQASQEAYDRYRSNYTKNKSKRDKKKQRTQKGQWFPQSADPDLPHSFWSVRGFYNNHERAAFRHGRGNVRSADTAEPGHFYPDTQQKEQKLG